MQQHTPADIQTTVAVNGQQHAYPRVAVVGSGYWGKNLVRNFHEIGALQTVCDSNTEVLASLSEQYAGIHTATRFAETLQDPTIQGVVIAAPAALHASLVREALLADKDVLVEKPLALNETHGAMLVRLAEERGRILMVGHLLWYHSAILKLKELISQGELGRLQYIYSQRLNLGRIRREENILWSFAPHDISVLLGLVGEMPDRIQAHGGYFLHKQICDTTVTNLSFPSGVGGHIFVSWLHPYKEQRLVVVGDRKMAVFNDLEPQDKLQLYPHTIEWQGNMPVPNKQQAQTVRLELAEPLRTECLHFLSCISTRQTPRTDGREALQVLQVLQRCQESLEEETHAGSAGSAPSENMTNGTSRQASASSPAVAGMAAPMIASQASSIGSIGQAAFIAHPTATVDEGAVIGNDTRIWHYCHIMPEASIGHGCSLGQNVFVARGVSIGDNVKIQNNVSVFEGVTIEDGVFCGPSMVFTNVINPRSEIERKDEFLPTRIRRGASLGANCTIRCGATVGQYAFIGAGSVVLKDVPDHALIVGNPGRQIGWMCQCGNRIEFAENNPEGHLEDHPEDHLEKQAGECQTCQQRYEKIDGRVTAL